MNTKGIQRERVCEEILFVESMEEDARHIRQKSRWFVRAMQTGGRHCASQDIHYAT